MKEEIYVYFIGTAGSGKSTLIRCINKLEDITTGNIVVNGYSLDNNKTKVASAL